MRFSTTEIQHIARAWAAITLAFAILHSGGISFEFAFLINFLMAGLTVGAGFLLHELAHKYFAQKYGCRSEFRAFDHMLVLAIIMSFFGFLFAAPGAVFIEGRINKARNGRISAAGPAANLVIAILFIGVFLAVPIAIVQQLALMGALINSWLGLFNLIPFNPFDGAKIFSWNKKVYGSLAASLFILLAVPYLIG